MKNIKNVKNKQKTLENILVYLINKYQVDI